MTIPEAVTHSLNRQAELFWHALDRREAFLEEKAFVRHCQAACCKGSPPFDMGERSCKRCDRVRPRAAASVLILGASAYEYGLIRDALDAEFNSFNFVGQVSGRVSRVGAGVWSIDEADLTTPASYDSKAIPAKLLIGAALRRAGLRTSEVLPAH